MSMIIDNVITLNGVRYVRPSYAELSEEDRETVAKLLHDIYGKLWAEAYYDPYNESVKKFATPLCKKMAQVNKILKFEEN